VGAAYVLPPITISDTFLAEIGTYHRSGTARNVKNGVGMSLYIIAAQPNPPGKDVARYGNVRNEQLVAEWVEFQAVGNRELIGDLLSHLTFDSNCQRTGADVLHKFGSITVNVGEKIRVHTGSGVDVKSAGTHHIYLNRSWYVWNNQCGDRVTVSYNNAVIDSAYYNSNPPEGQLYRVAGTDRLESLVTSRYA
jgi:hypothetical protein